MSSENEWKIFLDKMQNCLGVIAKRKKKDHNGHRLYDSNPLEAWLGFFWYFPFLLGEVLENYSWNSVEDLEKKSEIVFHFSKSI